MRRYPTITDIELAWRTTSSGVCVIVEGETELDDAWFYNRWFGYRAREITFFPQDGWERVVDAVTTLRVTLGARVVYGIVDRDFEENVSYDPFPPSGIYRTRRYTLENYLLDPDCWFSVLQPSVSLTSRRPKPGWTTADEARLTLQGLICECLPLSAYNSTLRWARQSNEAAFRSLPQLLQNYRDHPKALADEATVLSGLRAIQAHLGVTEDLAQMYTARLVEIGVFSDDELGQVVSGKYVHKLLSERFPLKLSGKDAWDDMVDAYLHKCPDPPVDLVEIIECILENARVGSSEPTPQTSQMVQ